MEAALALGSEESFTEGTLRQGTVQQACPSLLGVSISWDTRERFQAGRMLRLEVIFFVCFVIRDPGGSHTDSEAGDDDSEHPVFPPLVLNS